jgi:hypothetical protein
MKMTRKYVASHEAGHVVVATILNVGFTDVYIADSFNHVGEGGAIHYTPSSFHPIFDAKSEVILKMAGEAGVRLYAGRKAGKITLNNILGGGMWTDYKLAKDITKDMLARIKTGKMYPSYLDEFCVKGEFSVDKFIDSCFLAAYDILSANREFHARVTKALVETGELGFVQVKTLAIAAAREKFQIEKAARAGSR